MDVKWLKTALANLTSQTRFIARDDPNAAIRMAIAVEDAVEALKRFPALGRPGRLPGTRELVVPGTPYVLPYRVRNDTIEILRVLHGAQLWPKDV